MKITKPEIKPARKIWKHEKDFNSWLEENIEILNDRIGGSFVVLGREKETVEGLRADLKIEDEDREKEGIIESQLGESNYDHLGKLLTYLTTFGADIAVWIVEEPRQEHKRVVDWLNESTDKFFYFIKVECAKVEDNAVPLFTPISIPSLEMKEIREKRKPSETEIQQRIFWKGLLDKSNEKFSLFQNISPKTQGWIRKGSGIGGVSYAYRVRKNNAQVHLYIDTGSKSENKKIFDSLYSKKEDIEQKFGDELDWMRLDTKRASRIRKIVFEKGLDDRENWDEIQIQMIDSMFKLWKAFKEPIRGYSTHSKKIVK